MDKETDRMTKDERLWVLASQYKELKDEIDEMTARRSTIGERLCKELQDRELKSVMGKEFKVTLSEPEAVTYEDKKAEKTLGKQRWMKVSKRIIDKDKLHIAVQEGIVSVDELERFSTVTQRKAYVTVTPLMKDD